MPRTARPIPALRLLAAAAAFLATDARATDTRVVVAWDDPAAGASFVAALEAAPPFAFDTPALPVDGDGRVRASHGRVVHLSRSRGTLRVIEASTWSVERTFALAAAAAPRDVAVVDRGTAYVSRAAAPSILRLDLDTGATTGAIDLTPLGVGDGNPVMETMLVHDGRLYVQLAGEVALPPEPHFIAVIDLATEQIVDADPVEPGVQAIPLAGTGPRFKMQVVPGANRLLVSATGTFTDQGGLELVDLDALASLGVVIPEFEDAVGNDLGAFAMVDADRGWLVFSTDIVLSSHLHPFTLSAGAETFEAATALFYFAPHLVYDDRTDTLFWPEPGGVRAFDATTGAARAAATPLSGDPTDLALLPGPPPVPALSWGMRLAIGAVLAAAGAGALQRSGRGR